VEWIVERRLVENASPIVEQFGVFHAILDSNPDLRRRDVPILVEKCPADTVKIFGVFL
jgi:hypothetical protein